MLNSLDLPSLNLAPSVPKAAVPKRTAYIYPSKKKTVKNDGLLPGIIKDSIGILPGKKSEKGRPRQGRVQFLDAKTTCEAHVYRKDVIFKVKCPELYKHRIKANLRGEIKGFSPESARRLRLLIRNTDDLWTGFVTLTYPGPSFNFSPEKLDGPTCKKHIHAFCTWLGRQKIAYVWILEFQDRGIPHFHFLVSGFINKDRLSQKWYEIVGSGDIRHLAAGTRVDGVKNPDQVGAYMGSYMTKLDQKTVPEGFKRVGRFWGASRCLSKTTYRMQGLYREVSKELRVMRKANQGIRRGIASDQLKAAMCRYDEAKFADSPSRKYKLLAAARSCEWRAKSYAKKWEWKGFGFTLIRGAEICRSMMRQAVHIDQGYEPLVDESGNHWLVKKCKDGSLDVRRVGMDWEEWDGKPEKRIKYVSPLERQVLSGQYLLDGSSETGEPERLAEFKKRIDAGELISENGHIVPLSLSHFDFGIIEKKRGKNKPERGE